MLNIYKTKLLDLPDGVWYKKLNYNAVYSGRKMFLKNGEKNPYFDFEAFGKTVDHNLMYLSFVEDCDPEDIDCMSFGFGLLEYDVRKKLYGLFLPDSCTAALLRIPTYITYNEQYGQRVYADENFMYCIAVLENINNVLEEYLYCIIYSEGSIFNLSDKKIYTEINDIKYINDVMKKVAAVLLKTPYYAGYNYIVYYSDGVFGKISEACIDIEKKLNICN